MRFLRPVQQLYPTKMAKTGAILSALAATATALPQQHRSLQSNALTTGAFCQRFCEDGSQPTIDRAGDCPAGTLCLPPRNAGDGSDTCSFRAHVCTQQIDASCNMEAFRKSFCPTLAGTSMVQGFDQHAYACVHDPDTSGGVMRGLVGIDSSLYSCYTALAGSFVETSFADFCPTECHANHNAVAPSGPGSPGSSGGPCGVQVQAAAQMPGAYVPQCDEQGGFMPVQCSGSTGFCWCVDATGTEMTGTSARGASFSVDNCVGNHVGKPTPPSSSGFGGGVIAVEPPPLPCCTSMSQMGSSACVPCGALAPLPALIAGQGQRCAVGFCEDGNCPACATGLTCVVPKGMMCAGTCFGTCSLGH